MKTALVGVIALFAGFAAGVWYATSADSPRTFDRIMADDRASRCSMTIPIELEAGECARWKLARDIVHQQERKSRE